MINKRKIIRSLISYVPLLNNILKKRGTSPIEGRYYYNIYQTHKKELIKNGFRFPGKILAELGPGDSFGIGFCAILDGFESYVALDVIEHADINKNLKILSDIAPLFPGNKRIAELRSLLENGFSNYKYLLKYFVPWNYEEIIQYETVDLIISNAVLEHLLDIENAYKAMYAWLKPGGYMSHVIDYGAHEFSKIWYEHLYISNNLWNFLMHGRMYPINRFPHSFHINLLKSCGFEIINENIIKGQKAKYEKINKKIRKFFKEEDLIIKSAHIIARKPK